MLFHINELRPLRRLGVTRSSLLEELDRPALKPLPTEPYVYAEWRIRRAGLDCHVEIDDHYYSVPHRFANEELSARITARTVEVFRKGERIAVHPPRCLSDRGQQTFAWLRQSQAHHHP